MSRIVGYNTVSNARYPVGKNMPNYIYHGEGCYVWDEQGRKYIDWTASLGTVITGYNESLCGFHCLPMKTDSEELLADLLCEIYNMDKVRFFKNGSDATDAAIRLARYHTGINTIASCGYHGWHDCFSYTYGRHKSGYNKVFRGVVERQQQMGEIDWDFHYWKPDDLQTVINSKPSCIIIEPLDRRYPQACTAENLHRIQKLCKDNGILFILDEILSGFRMGKGGITELYGLDPDLVCLGKAMSNGMPLSALIGKANIMADIEDLFITGTYFTDDLSFKQAIKTIQNLNKDDFIKTCSVGCSFLIQLNCLINKYNLEKIVMAKGFGPWVALDWKDKLIEHLFLQEIIKEGILTNRDYFVMFSHTQKDMDNTIEAHDKVFKLINENRNNLEKLIETTRGI